MGSNNPRYGSWKRREAVRRYLLATQDVCAICGKPIDKGLGKVYGEDGSYTWHPMAPEVDEIVPISKGGSPYERSNCQLVHRICNQRKGNRTEINSPKYLALPKSREW